MRHTTHLALLAGLTGCDPWARTGDHDGWGSLDQPTWDPAGVVTAGDTLYVRLPHAGDAVRLTPGADPERLDLGDRRVERLVVSPDGATVIAATRGVRCDTFEDVEALWLEDCPFDDRVVEATLEVLTPEAATFEVGPRYGDLVFSSDGRFAVALQDPSAQAGGGVVNLTSVMVLDLEQGAQWEVSVGFRASRVLFTGGDLTTGMVVLSQSEVALVDLTQPVPTPGTVFPLTLDADTNVSPVDVALTPDDAYALITVEGAGELYVLDLVDPSINLVTLAGAPSAMAVDAARDQTVLAFRNRSTIEILDHALFDVTSIDVDEVSTDIWLGGDFALLWNRNGGQDVYRLDLATLRLDEYRLNFAPYGMRVAPDATFAVALGVDGGSPRLEVLDLREVDGRVRADTRPFGLSGRALDVAFVSTEGGVTALLLQQGVDTLFELSWPELAVAEVELPSAPAALGALDDGAFWISHTDRLGLVSFYTPGGEVTSVGGFARFGLHDRQRLLADEEE